MDENDAKKIVESGAESVMIRSILTCEAKHGVCTNVTAQTSQTENRLLLVKRLVSLPLSPSVSRVPS